MVFALDRGFEFFREPVQVVLKIGQQNVVAHLLDGGSGIAGEPVCYDFLFGSHRCIPSA